MAAMKTNKHIQIFKTGQHTAMGGAALSFSDADLAATAAAYDPAKHEAPLVCGHPIHNDPAYGWVRALSFTDGGLEATPAQVNADFAELIASGAFKKISASFYSPDSPSNPVPGVYYLRHVGFLGAQPPAVKGMRNPSFADNEQGVVEFSDWDDVQNASLWRRLRDWMIGKEGLDVADSILPDYTIASLEQSARQEDNDDQPAGAMPQFIESQLQGDDMSVEDKARLAVLEQENTRLKAEQATFAEAENKRAADARHAEHASFAEVLVKAGKLLPAQKDVAVATLDFMASQDQVVEFGEGDAKKPLADAFKDLLQAAPKQVEFAEVGKAGSHSASAAEIIAPNGYQADQGRMDIHVKALSYSEQHKVDYVTAVKAVEKS
jgi:hypothetical protein